MKTTDDLNSELSKHRKLLHRAVGNRIVPHINYHHYEIVRIIEEIKESERLDFEKHMVNVLGMSISMHPFNKEILDAYMKSEDIAILTGNFSTSVSVDGTHLDTHISK